jgi:CheY-like chemotaxis protein
MMPEVDGFSVLENIKLDEKLHEIPVIVITAKDLSHEDYRRLSGKVESLLQKGEFIEEELFNSLGDLLS